MKKILFTLAIVAMAVCTQAASIDWAITANTWTVDGGTKPAKGTTVYLINTADLAAITSAIDGGTTSFTTSDAGILGVGTTSNTKGAVQGTATSSALTAGTSYNVAYMVIQDGKYFVSGAKSAAAYDPADPVYSEPSGPIFAAVDFNNPLTPGGWTDAGGGTPEPTSGLLLLVGGAMLALRRKQKK